MASIQSGGYNPGEPATPIIMLLAIIFQRLRYSFDFGVDDHGC
jgi:hypothetical protein